MTAPRRIANRLCDHVMEMESQWLGRGVTTELFGFHGCRSAAWDASL